MIIMKYFLCIVTLIGFAFLVMTSNGGAIGAQSVNLDWIATRIICAILTGAALVGWLVIESAQWILDYMKAQKASSAN